MLLLNPALTNVVQTGIARGRIAPGMVLDRVQLIGSGTAFDFGDHISRVLARQNEKIVLDLTGQELIDVQTSKGIAQTANKVCIDFIDLLATNAGSLYMGAHDMSRGSNGLDVEITTSGAPADVALDWKRDVRPAAPNSPGIAAAITTYTKHTMAVTAAGRFTHMPSVGPNRPAKIRRLWFKGANVTAVGVKKDGLFVHEEIPLADQNADLTEHGRSPVAGYYMIDFVRTGFAETALFTGNAASIEYLVTTSGAGNVDIITEQVIELANL